MMTKHERQIVASAIILIAVFMFAGYLNARRIGLEMNARKARLDNIDSRLDSIEPELSSINSTLQKLLAFHEKEDDK